MVGSVEVAVMGSEPISSPLDSLEQLQNRSLLSSPHLIFHKCYFPLLNSALPTSQKHRPRLLVCHDMMGGYQEDKWIQGSPNSDAYSLWHWHLIDIFVYFSHSLVTVPPPCWTNAAHKHGVQVLGTFITEWSEGAALCKRLLASRESVAMYASRLAELAEVLGFDGWLINIENEVDKEHIDNLMEFVKLLTIYMHKSVPGSVVIWYDSVTKDGELKWQDCLNDKNKSFFDLCDGIFTNYTWKTDDPEICALNAGARRYDVYMGVDVFGRNTYGGGGFESNVAVQAARKAGVSVALFAPAWVYETKQQPNFPAAQNRWWGLLADCWPSAQQYPSQLPFFSSFDQGFGKEMYVSGKRVSRVPWSNISCQSLQPILHIETGPREGIFEIVSSGEQPVYNGGACLKLFGEMEEQTYCLTRLYKSDVLLTSDPLLISYTVRHVCDSRISLLFKIHDQKGVTNILLVDPEEVDNGRLCDHDSPKIVFRFPSRTYQVQDSQEWTFREYQMEVTGKLEGIFGVSYLYKIIPEKIVDLCKGIPFASSGSVTSDTSKTILSYKAFLGHIAVSNSHNHGIISRASFEHPNVTTDELSGQKVISLMLTWIIEGVTDAQIAQYNIYVSKVDVEEELEHVGVAVVRAFYVSELPVPENCTKLTFYLQMCCMCGISNSLENAHQVVVPVPSVN